MRSRRRTVLAARGPSARATIALLVLMAGLAGAAVWSAAAAAVASAEDLAAQLDFPRDDAEGAERGRAVLRNALLERGLQVRELPFACRAGRAPAAALALATAALVLVASARRRSRRLFAAAVAALCLGPAALAGILDGVLPVSRRVSLETVIEARGMPRAEVLLGAHLDSKTEPLDHVGRSFLFGMATLVWAAAAWGVGKRARTARPLTSAAALCTALAGLQLGAGSFLRQRSHGVLDDGASAALLVEMAGELRHAPLEQTRLRFAWWDGEEVGAQGSAAYARAWDAKLPRSVINLECIGAGPDLAWAEREWTGSRFAAASAALVALVAAAAPRPPRPMKFPVLTDAGSFLRLGIPALTILELPRQAVAVRGLHGPRDRITALDREGLDLARRTLRELLPRIDAQPPARAQASER